MYNIATPGINTGTGPGIVLIVPVLHGSDFHCPTKSPVKDRYMYQYNLNISVSCHVPIPVPACMHVKNSDQQHWMDARGNRNNT